MYSSKKDNSPFPIRGVQLFIGVLLVLSLIPSILAIKLFPNSINLNEAYTKEQNFVITLVNDGPKTEEIDFKILPNSDYLSPYIKLEPLSFMLFPNGKKNIVLTTNFPKDLPVGNNVFEISPNLDSEIFSLHFFVPGIQDSNLEIEDMTIQKDENLIILNITILNKGNIICWADPTLKILNGSKEVGNLEYKSNLQILPSTRINFSLLYDISSLDKGNYTVEVQLNYNENLKTNKFSQDLLIESNLKHKTKTYISILKIFLLILLIISFLIILKTKLLKKPDPYKDILLRQKKAEKELMSVANEIQQFIKDSNQWLEKNKKEFRFK